MFFGKKKTKAVYVAYMTKMMKYKGVIDKFQQDTSSSKVLLLYYFEQTRDEMKALLKATGVSFQEISSGQSPGDGYILADANGITESLFDQVDSVYALEAHPIYSINNQPLSLAKGSPIKEITWFTGMDEPVMAAFGSARIIKLMEQIGVNPEEEISHSMISTSIQKGQQKIEKSIPAPKDIRTSQEQWAEVNKLEKLNS
ncbi:MAG: hypothetical protein JXQ90_16220 [Cyclobacteriaceae bacterium]